MSLFRNLAVTKAQRERQRRERAVEAEKRRSAAERMALSKQALVEQHDGDAAWLRMYVRNGSDR